MIAVNCFPVLPASFQPPTMSAFLPDLHILGAYILACIVLAITPGPDMTLFIGRTLSHGRGHGVASLLGASMGNLVHTLLVVVGISALIAASPTGFLMLKVAGALYLLWLAWQAIRHGSTFSLDSPKRKALSLKRAFLSGLMVNILNPKIILFYITFLPQFVDAGDPDAWKKLLFLGVFFVVFSTPPLIGLIYAAHRFSEVMRQSPKLTRVIDWLFATIFAGFAIRILMTQGR